MRIIRFFAVLPDGTAQDDRFFLYTCPLRFRDLYFTGSYEFPVGFLMQSG